MRSCIIKFLKLTCIADVRVGGAGGLSLKSKIKLCEAWNLLQRCREERLLPEKEMRSCFTFWTDKHEAISLRINALQDDIMPTSPDHFAEVLHLYRPS